MIVAGTGHRPNKLGGYSEEAFHKLTDLAVDCLRNINPSKVIAGGAIGWDQALANAAYYLKIPLILAYPFAGFNNKWPANSIGMKFHKEMEAIMQSTSAPITRHYVCKPGYAVWKMQVRNKWMVDNCDLVLALWDGSEGGTGNCIKYANSIGKPIKNLWETYV